MNKRRYHYTELGMLLGLVVGAGLATILVGITGNAVYWAITGIGLALGLSLGAAFDARKQTEGKDEPPERFDRPL